MMPLAQPRREAGDAEVGRLTTLYQLLAALSQASAITDVYRAALDSLLTATGADRAAVLLFEEDGVMRFQAWRGLSADYRAAVTGHSPWTPGVPDARPIAIPDVRLAAEMEQLQPALASEGIRGLLFVPLALDAGVFGKLMLYYAEPHEWQAGEISMAQAIASHVALATQQKRSELARRNTEQRLRAILDNSPSVIFLKDRNGRYLHINRRYEELFHLTRAEAVGRTDHQIFPPQVAEQFRANDQAVLENGTPLTVEEFAPHDDGLHAYISAKFPLTDTDGEVVAVCGISTDVTEQKRLETAAQRLAAIVESSEDAIISKDLNGIVTSWNQSAERTFGYTAAEMVGKPISVLAAPDRIDEMPTILSRIRRGERVEHFETRRRRKDGRVIHVSLTVSPVRNAAGEIIGASKIARDITGRKEAEQERQLLLAREQEARRTAELLNRIGPRLAAELDIDKLVQEVTDIATTLVGAECGAFLRNMVNEEGESHMLPTISGENCEAFPGLSMEHHTELFHATLRGKHVIRIGDIATDARYEAPGSSATRSYLGAPVVARSGEVLGGLFFTHSQPDQFTANHEALIIGIAAQAAIATDNARLLEQAQRNQAELKRSNEDLRRANRDLEVFAYSAGHDLQEPLRTIGISAQLIERSWGGRLQGNEATFLKNILTSSRRMSVFLEDLLTYTRASRGEAGPPPATDSRQVLVEVLGSMQGLVEESGAIVTAQPLPVVAIHENRLAQLFQNLIGNAIKYRSEEAPSVQISAARHDSWFVFSVMDNGIGIEAQFAEKIFGLFKRLHGRDEYPGSGIGLAICQRIVEQYGGRIWLEQSEPGRGSTFCFSVPAHG